MYILVAIIIILLFFFGLTFLLKTFKDSISFYINGLNEKFSIRDITTLWKTAQICDLIDPSSLYWSLPSLTKCMTQLSNLSSDSNANPSYQLLLAKLFEYRTKLQTKSDSKKGIDTTLELDKKQKLRIVLAGKGVFSSEILHNGKEIIIDIPKQNNLIPVTAEEWVGKVINIYLWRRNDASYVFDTTVDQAGIYLGHSALYLKHSNNLLRTQKRKTLRADCDIYAELFLAGNVTPPNTHLESNNLYKCHIENVSESGALIRIKGKGKNNINIKLQYKINDMIIVMYGVVRTVEYNEQKNESLLHFECTLIDFPAKNEILSFVFNLLPKNEKEIIEAINQTEEDKKEDDDLLKIKDNDLNNESKDKTINMDETYTKKNDIIKEDQIVDESINVFDDYQKPEVK